MNAILQHPTSQDAEVRPAPSSSRTTPSRYSALLAVIPGAAALAICLHGLADRSMWNNEYATWHATSISLADFAELLRRTDLAHVLYYMIIRGWMAVGGDSPLQMRLLSVVSMALCAVFITLIGRRLLGTPVGVFAGLFFAVIPAVSRYGQEARSYALVTVAGAFATLMLLRALEKPSRTRLILYGIGVALMGLIHFVSLTLLAAHFILWLNRTRGNTEHRWRVAIAVGFGMLGVIWLPALASHQSASISWIKADRAAIMAFPADMFLSGPVAVALAVLSVLGFSYLMFVPTVRNRPVATMLAAWAVVPPIFVLVTFPLLHMFLPRYVLVVLPAWSLLAAVGAYLSGALIWRYLGPVTATIFVTALLWVALPAHAVVRQSPVYGQPDYRAAIMMMQERQQPGDGVVFNDVFGKLSDLAREAFDYELRDAAKPRDVFLDKTAAQRASFSASECANPAPCLRDEKRIWLIHTGWSKDPFDGMPPARSQVLKLNYTVAETIEFTDVNLVLLKRRP
ncbi:glycosyltransferase family 39 protein [Actinoplanes sp. NPDC051346]|uniref:glycosyltransferase family 39 protein n=1 Tax=Actinoplanes sp. NPDC051346 TaxID=3155048 RepID=UPI003423FA7E